MAQRIKNNSVTREEEDTTKKIYSDSGGINNKASAVVGKSTSLTSLIIWNVTKALELNPKMVVKHAIKVAQARLEADDVKSIIPEFPEERHLACALLAWQQLGHTNADSLCEFVDDQINSNVTERMSKLTNKDIENSKQKLQNVAFPNRNLSKIDCYSMGPVIKLPTEPKVVMRIENSSKKRQTDKMSKEDEILDKIVSSVQDDEIMDKIEAACCMDSECVDRLTAVDAATKELRMRAAKLARREAERVELLERAETAWKDLELGYQRRLTLAQEKEDDLSKQIRQTIEERNGYKNACMLFAKNLKETSDRAESDRVRLSQIDKQLVCDRACNRQRLSEESAKTDAILTEHQCKAAQIERDLLYKEEQARRQVLNIECELESAKTLTHEAERAMRAELAALKDQVSEVSQQLLEEDAQSERIKELLADMRQEKMDMITDLEGCKKVCDDNMQIITNELNKKRQELVELKEKMMECRCKLPVDASVEAKRTPSLAALCRCTAEDKILDACSCTSIRSRLLSNLLSDLFSGLQTELGGASSAEMPCQLLKCLEDKHNWDRASVVKTNLKNYFSHLLLGELDIAITNCIEKYHARWVGETCADTITKMSPDSSEAISEEGWQERVIEKRAQKLATELAEQLFKERADQLTQQAMEYVSKGPPPCECKPANTDAAVYPCLVKTVPQLDSGLMTPPPPWKEAIKDVTQLRQQIEDLKKESLKKQDLKEMELKIAKIMKHASCTENNSIDNNTSSLDTNVIKRDQRFNKSFNSKLYASQNKYGLFKKKHAEAVPKRGNKLNSADNSVNVGNDKNFKYKKFGQTHVIHPCSCSQKEPNKMTLPNKNQSNGLTDKICKPKTSFIVNNVITSKPIEGTQQFQNLNLSSKSPREGKCHNVCFHRVPSNTSIDKLLETLTKWKTDIDKLENNEAINRQPELVPCQCPATKRKTSKSSTDLKKRKKRIKKHDCLNLDSDQYGNSRKSSEISLESKRSTAASLRSARSKKEEKPPGCKLKTCASSITKFKNKTPSMCSVKPCKSNDSNRKVNSKSTVSIKKVESEYMGAINLDKSNEDLCKCSNEKNKTKPTKPSNTPVPPDKLFKCITSSKCNCDKVLKTRSIPTKRKDTNDIPLQDIKKDSNKCFINFVNKENNPPPPLDKNSSHVKPVTDCNYNIKFLGVTLADVDSKKQHVEFMRENEETNTSLNSYRPTDIPLTNECGCIINPNFTQAAKKGGGETVSVCCVSEQFKNTKEQINEERTNRQCFDKMLSCECIAQFDEFKNYIDMALQQECPHSDKSLDTQSFFIPIAEPENCVCCNNIYGDESKELEENAFHLLEEHLKQKLEEFKETSCQSSCIPPEEEKRLFSTILKRVKKVISESTNKITCKCSGKGGDGQGSWNRAYGLLQEYLKMKIKRVQCSCVLVEDNKDTILPDVLDKVCNLIESDFKRLKDVCECQPKTDVTKKDKKKLNFTSEVPEKDVNVDIKTFIDKPDFRRSIYQESILSQVSNDFGRDAKSCDPMEPFIKKIHASQDVQSFQSLINEQECNYCAQKEIDSNTLDTNRLSKLDPHNKNETNVLKGTNWNDLNRMKVGSKRDRCLSVPCIYARTNVPCTNDCSFSADLSKKNMKRVNETKNTSSKGMIIVDEHCVDINNITIPEKISSSKSCEIKNTLEQHDEAISKQHFCNIDAYECNRTHCNKNETTGAEMGLESVPISPYIGFTIECSCENKLGKCVCGRGTFKPNKEIINNVWKNSLQNKNYIDKVAYILNNTNEKNNDAKKECYTAMTDNLIVQTDKVSKQQDINFNKFDRETGMSAISDEALRDSNEQFDIDNTMTNTYDDNDSDNTEYSINEESLDWCECCSQIKTDIHSQFKKSIYYPAPLQDNYDDPSKSDTNFSFRNDAKHRKHCNCEMVPICHVKMLVENIENKLASSKCTCDSLIPKVCPVHTPK